LILRWLASGSSKLSSMSFRSWAPSFIFLVISLNRTKNFSSLGINPNITASRRPELCAPCRLILKPAIHTINLPVVPH